VENEYRITLSHNDMLDTPAELSWSVASPPQLSPQYARAIINQYLQLPIGLRKVPPPAVAHRTSTGRYGVTDAAELSNFRKFDPARWAGNRVAYLCGPNCLRERRPSQYEQR
jgi:hypothetical protein